MVVIRDTKDALGLGNGVGKSFLTNLGAMTTSQDGLLTKVREIVAGTLLTGTRRELGVGGLYIKTKQKKGKLVVLESGKIPNKSKDVSLTNGGLVLIIRRAVRETFRCVNVGLRETNARIREVGRVVERIMVIGRRKDIRCVTEDWIVFSLY